MFSSTFLPGMAGSIVSAGTYAGGALLITAEGLVTGSRIEEIATGNNSLKNYLDSNPIGGVVDYESLVEAKDLIFVMYLAAGGEAAKFNREYEELLVASRENSGARLFNTSEELQNHYKKHKDQISKVLGKDNYTIDDYLDDANYIIKNGTYTSELNAYVKFMGRDKYGFVGLDRNTGNITTFHIKTVSYLAEKAPSLGLEK